MNPLVNNDDSSQAPSVGVALAAPVSKAVLPDSLTLTTAQITLLRECVNYSLCENYSGPGYVRLGGSGYSPLRRDYRVRRALVDMGFLSFGSVLHATQAGKDYISTLPTP